MSPSTQSPRDAGRKELYMNPESPAMAERSGQLLPAASAQDTVPHTAPLPGGNSPVGITCRSLAAGYWHGGMGHKVQTMTQ